MGFWNASLPHKPQHPISITCTKSPNQRLSNQILVASPDQSSTTLRSASFSSTTLSSAGFAERVSGEVFAGGSETGVVYTTSLRGVRKTFEDYNRVHRVVFDERDVSLHREFLRDVKELVGEAVALPWVFVKGRYMGVWRNWWS